MDLQLQNGADVFTKRMKILKTILLGVVLFGCTQFLASCTKNPVVVVESIYPGDVLMWNHIFNADPAINFLEKPAAVILPHHMIVGQELAKFYKGLTKVTDPSVVVVISPNHYQNGDPDVQVCKGCSYETVNGVLPLNSELINKMIKDGISVAKDDTFIKEHGLFNHAPFIKKFFPKTTFVPIALKWETTPEETVELAKWLNESLPEDALVIASVDFSHYIPIEGANFHDITSYATIKNFDYDNIYNLEIDSPPSISAIAHFSELRGAQKVPRFMHTNNQDYHTERIDSTTSHQFIGFFKGEKEPEKSVTIFSVGNTAPTAVQPVAGATITSTLGLYDNYHWNINAATPNLEISPFLRDIRGQEDRFLVGANFLAFDMSHNTCTLKEKNGLKISFCHLDQNNSNSSLTEQLALIRQQKSLKADYIYLLFYYSDSQFTPDKKQLAQDFLAAGADIFVGRGIKETLPIDQLNGKILAYSLGDFITDPSVQKSDGTILEIALTPNGPELFTFPIEINNGYPKLKTPRP